METIFDKYRHGVAYYPEVWDEEDSEKNLQRDLEKFKKFGIDTVRMGEFAWSYFERDQGRYCFDLFDEVIDRLGKAGISTIMCTPTAAPPRWLSYEHPEVLVKDIDGHTLQHGSRLHCCYNSEVFLKATENIVSKMAEHFGKNENIIAWQIHNEFCFNNDFQRYTDSFACYCDNCRKKWAEYLRKKYKTIENFNKKFGFKIWSVEYDDFDQVVVPAKTPYLHNSGFVTEYANFSAQSITEYSNKQADCIRKYSDIPVTTNSNRYFYVNHEELFKNLDFVSFDDYADEKGSYELFMDADFYRGLKKDVPFICMECSPSHGGSNFGVPDTLPKGFNRAFGMAQFFGGSKAVCYWLYQQHRSGAEMLNGSILSAWGEETAESGNVTDLANALKKEENFLRSGKVKRADVALYYSARARSAFIANFCESAYWKSEVNYIADTRNVHRAISQNGLYRDFVFEGEDLSGYRLIVIPYALWVSDELIGRIRDALQAGATVIVGPYSGWRDETLNFHKENALGKLEELAGIKVMYQTSLRGNGVKLSAFGYECAAEGHCAVMPADERSLGRIKHGYCDGLSFISENRVLNGKIVLLGSKTSEEMLSAMIRHYAEECGLKPFDGKDLLMFKREQENETMCCFVNISNKEVKTDSPYGKIDLRPYEYCYKKEVR